jgi:hypothetical protein
MQADYFSKMLLEQMARAIKRGAKSILINSHELHCTLGHAPGADHVSAACDEAMKNEMATGDTVIVEKENGWGFTVRYALPRLAHESISLSDVASAAAKIAKDRLGKT